MVLAQITYIIALEFFGIAVKAGSSHAVLWLAAVFLFFVPQELVVRYLNQLMLPEGGVYEWARTMPPASWWRGICGSRLSYWSLSTVL